MTENLDNLRKLDGAPATVAAPPNPAKPVPTATHALAVAEADHAAKQHTENQLRIKLADAQRELGLSAQRLQAAYKAYDASLQQERRMRIDPAARPAKV